MKHKITAPPVINHSGRKISATRKVRGLKYLWPVQKMKWCGCYQSRNKIWPRGSRSISWLDSWQGLNDNFIKQDKVNSAESELAVGFRLVSSLIWVYLGTSTEADYFWMIGSCFGRFRKAGNKCYIGQRIHCSSCTGWYDAETDDQYKEARKNLARSPVSAIN